MVILRRFLRDECGATMVEMSLVITLLSVGLTVTVGALPRGLTLDTGNR